MSNVYPRDFLDLDSYGTFEKLENSSGWFRINIAVTVRQTSKCNKAKSSIFYEVLKKDTFESTIALHRIRKGFVSANNHSDVYVFLGGITSLCEPNWRSWYWASANVCVRTSSSIFPDIYCRFLSSIFGVYFLVRRPRKTTVSWDGPPKASSAVSSKNQRKNRSIIFIHFTIRSKSLCK